MAAWVTPITIRGRYFWKGDERVSSRQLKKLHIKNQVERIGWMDKAASDNRRAVYHQRCGISAAKALWGYVSNP